MLGTLQLAAVALLGAAATPVLAHMTLASPVPFGDPTTSPLSSDGSNYPCQIVGSPASFFADTAAAANNTMAVGATQTLSFHGSAVHGGGSCQLALTSELQPSASTAWQVILSIEGGCPTTDGAGPSTYDFTIPSTVTPGKYVFAWTWISKLSGAPEYYMNCAPVTVTGGATAKAKQRDTSALPNLFVANLASINSCKTTTSTDPLFPDPGPNVLKPSKMTTNFQAPSGTDCFPLGASNSTGSDPSAAPAAASSAKASASTTSATSTTSTTSTAPTTLTTLTTSTTSGSGTGAVTTTTTTTAAAATGPAHSSGGVFITTPSANATAAATTAAPTTAVAATTTAAPSSASNGTTTPGGASGGGLSGPCSAEGMFNCVGGTQYQQCASSAWTALRDMPSGTQCQVGQSTTLWARRAAKRLRRVRRL